MTDANAQGSRFDDATLAGAILRSVDFSAANLNRVVAHGADFRDATLRGATLSAGRFEKASFRDSVLDAADLAGGNFDGADFRDASMQRTVLYGADLAHARGLTQDQLDEACADSRTRLPPGLTGKTCSGLHISIHGPRMIVVPPIPSAAPAPRYLVATDPTP